MTITADRLERAVSLHRLEKFDEAEAIYREYLADNPQHHDALNLLGVICGQTDRLDEARALLEHSVRVRSNNASAHFNLANVLREMNQLRSAVKHYRTTIRLQPDHIGAHLNMAAAHLQLGRTRDAIEVYEGMLRIDPANNQALGSLSQVLIDRGETERLHEMLNRLNVVGSRRAAMFQSLADSLREAGEFEKAQQCYREAIDADPTSIPALCNLAGLLADAGDSTAAINVAECAIAIDPNCAEAWGNLATALLDRWELPRALDAAQHAVELRPDSFQSHAILVSAMRQAGRVDEAIAHMTELASRLSGSTEAWAKLGQLLRECGRLDEAREAYTKARSCDRTNPAARAALLRLEVIAPTAPLEETVKDAALAITEFPHVIVHTSAAEVFATAGDHARAIDLLTPLEKDERLSARERRTIAMRLGSAHDRLRQYEEAFQCVARGNALIERTYDHDMTTGACSETKQVFTAERIEGLGRFGDPTEQYVFIGGLPRSGTTLIEQIIDSHPQACGVGELSVGARIAGMIPSLVESDHRYPICMQDIDSHALRECGERVHSWIRDASGSTQAIRVCEKSPNNTMHFGLLAAIFPHARFIVVDRDLRDTCLSCFFHDFAGHYPWSYDLCDLVHYTSLHVGLMQHWTDMLADRLMVLSYERLVNEFEAEAQRLIEFCRLPWDTACLSFDENQRRVLTASREQVRKPIYRSSIGRWRNYERHLTPLLDGLAEFGV